MATMQFRDFTRRCRAGFWAIGCGAVLWIAVWGIIAGNRSCTNDSITLKNAVIRSLKEGTTKRAMHSFDDMPQSDRRYVELMHVLLRDNAKKESLLALARFKGVAEDDLEVPLRMHEMLGGLISREDRVRNVRAYLWPNPSNQPSHAGEVDEIVDAWMFSIQEHREHPKLNPQPLEKPEWEKWSVFAIVLYGIANLVMMMCFLWREWDGHGATAVNRWVFPVNPGSWLIMLAFAPAFAIPWFFRGVYFSILRPLVWGIGGTGRGIKWLLVDFSVEEVARKGRERRERKLTERRRRTAEEQMAVAEQAKVGADVAALRIELKAFIEQAKFVQDKGERERLIRRLAEAGSKLESTAQTRGLKTKTNGDAPVGIVGQVEDIATRIDALYESENL